MERKITVLVAAATIATALGIGAAMQYWPAGYKAAGMGDAPLVMSDVLEVSSTPKSPLPVDVTMDTTLPVALVSKPVETTETALIDLPEGPKETGFACDITMSASPAAGAMMTVHVSAPCHGSERVTIHHNGLMFTDVMQPDGTLDVEVPALVENALVIASFLDGAGAVAHATVSSVPFYDRIVLQWRGNAGLQLHAREFDAEYFSDGHVWHGANTDAARAATGEGGFLISLGESDAPDALLAEVYTFPTGMTDAYGTVVMTVEAEIRNSNCESVVEAQTLEVRQGRGLTAKELTIDVPSCTTIGDFLLLKNIVEDLTIAAK